MVQPANVRLITEEALNDRNLLPATRGVPSGQIDLDTLRGPADMGSYSKRLADLVNHPYGEATTNPLVNIEITRNVANGVMQRLTSSLGVWVRIAASESAWAEWRRILEDSDLPIVASSSTELIPDGGTLYVVQSGVAATDFDDGLTGWRESFDREGWYAATVTEFGDRTGISYVGNNRSYFVWDEFPNVTDVEILARALVRAKVTTINGGVAARVSGTAGADNGFVCSPTVIDGVDSLVIARYVAGGYARVASAAFPYSADAPYYLRFRVEGELLRAKAWMASSVEPDDWMITAENTQVAAAGGVGFYRGGSAAAWDYVSVDTTGGSA